MPLKYKIGDRVWYWQEGFYMDLFSMKSTGPYKKKEMAEIVGFTEPQYLKRSGVPILCSNCQQKDQHSTRHEIWPI